MDETTGAVAESPVAATSPGTDSPTGQAPSTPAGSENPTTADATPSAQAPASTPKYRFKDQAEAERAHSELQRRFSRVGDPDQAAQRLALLGNLQRDPKFVEWARARLAEQETGQGDPETVKALQIVEAVAERKAREHIAPYAAYAAAANQAAVYQAMTQKYPDWREYQTQMAEVLKDGLQNGWIPPNARMSMKFLETLYHAATGADPNFAAKKYAKTLEQKRATSTQASPGPAASAVATSQARSFEDAFGAAKRALGMA